MHRPGGGELHVTVVAWLPTCAERPPPTTPETFTHIHSDKGMKSGSNLQPSGFWKTRSTIRAGAAPNQSQMGCVMETGLCQRLSGRDADRNQTETPQ